MTSIANLPKSSAIQSYNRSDLRALASQENAEPKKLEEDSVTISAEALEVQQAQPTEPATTGGSGAPPANDPPDAGGN